MIVFVFGTVLIATVFKLWYIWTTGICKSYKRMDGKTVIVTGSNTGIGKETAQDLAKRGARVILACKDLSRGKKAQDEIIATSGNKNVVLHHLDLASLDSVRKFAGTIISTESRLDVLINNAGSGLLPNKKTADGLQILMQVNHFGPFLLTILLLDLLKKSAPSRIIMVSSIMHNIAILKIDNLNCEKSHDISTTYSNSKLCNILVANELARRLQGTGVTCNSLHPGVVLTDIWRNFHPIILTVLTVIFGIFCKNPIEGAQTTIHLAVSEEVDGVTGKYFEDCKVSKPSKFAQDEGFAKKVWERSEELVKLKPTEKIALE